MTPRQFAKALRGAATEARNSGADPSLDLAVALPPTSFLGWVNGMPIEFDGELALYVAAEYAELLAEEVELESGLIPVAWTEGRTAGYGLWAIDPTPVALGHDPKGALKEMLRRHGEGEEGPPWRA